MRYSLRVSFKVAFDFSKLEYSYEGMRSIWRVLSRNDSNRLEDRERYCDNKRSVLHHT